MSAADKYEQIRILGEGSFGKVYLMRDKVRRALVCVKVIKIRNIPRKEREATRMEVDLLRRLNHPNIVRYLDSFSSSRGESLCIAMEYCDGGDLASQITNQSKNNRRQLFGENKILHWFVQMTLGLHYMHTNKVLHRDLKTQNVFLLGNGRLVLGDLGISKVLDGTMDFAQTCIGTPYYMSPEIFKNKPYSYKSDIWALGCVLYEMTTLKHAFDASSLSGLAQKIIKGRFVPISTKYSRHLKELINRMLHVSPSMRPDCDQILRMPFIKRHIVNFFVDIHNRPQTNIGEGTMIVRGAIGQASDIQAHLRNDNNMLSLREQLKHLDMTEDMAKALNPPQDNLPVKSGSDLRRRVRDQTGALRREEDHKKMIESALERLRKEKEERVKEKAAANNVMPMGGRGAGRPIRTGASNVPPEQDRLAIYREKQAKERAEEERRRERERKEKREHERERQVSAKERLREREIAHRNRLEEEARQNRIAAFHEDERQRKLEAERVDQKRREEIRVEARRKEEARIREEVRAKEEAKRDEEMSNMMAKQRQDLMQAKQQAAERRNQQREKERERQRKEIEQLKLDKLMLDQRTADREAKKKERQERERSTSRNSNAGNSNSGSNIPSREPTPPPCSTGLASGDNDNAHDINNNSIFKNLNGREEGDSTTSTRDAVLQRAQEAKLKEAAERSEVLKAEALQNKIEREKAAVRGRNQYVSSPDTSNAVGVGHPSAVDGAPCDGAKGSVNMDLDTLTEKLQQATKGNASRFGNKPGNAARGDAAGYDSRFDYGDDSSDEDDAILKQVSNERRGESKVQQEEEEARLSQDFHRMLADEDDEESLFGNVDNSNSSEVDADIEAREEELQQELNLSLARVDVLKKTVQDTVTFAVKVDSSVGNITRIGEIGRVAAKELGENGWGNEKESSDNTTKGGKDGEYIIEEELDSDEDEEEDEILKSLLREVTNQGSPPRSARSKSVGKDESKSEDDIITPRRVIRPDMAVNVNMGYDHPSGAPPAYADLADPPSPLGKLGQRSERLRQHLLSNIGKEAFEQAYDYLKRRESDETLSTEDVDLDKDPVLVSILGNTRMQFAEDVDQLIFLENFHQG